jgi:hypothetical protein
MGKQLSFTEENVKKNAFDYPKLKLAKGETALLTVVENPYSEYVHSVQKPILDQATNKVLYETKEKKDKTEYQVPKLSFVSNPICLGDEDVLAEDGLDPVNCPVCAKAAAGEGNHWKPKRRFAMHVIRTNTTPGTFDANGTGGQLLIWAFTDVIFNKLYTLQKQWGLDTHDLQLGPCTDPGFQKADLNIAPGTAVDEAQRALLFAEKNRSTDPTVFCGNRKTKARIEDDLKIVDAEWARAAGTESDGLPVTTVASLSEGISSLLDEKNPKDEQGWSVSGPEATQTAKETATPVASFDALPDTAPAAEKPAAPASKPAADTSLDSILDSL